MPKAGKEAERATYVVSSLVVSFRSTLGFFAQRDTAMDNYYPEPFPHWERGDRHFNLICSGTRRVIRFEPNRFIARAEGQENSDRFAETVAIAKKLSELFGATDFFGASVTSIRAAPIGSLASARTRFVEDFLTDRSKNLLTYDSLSDFSVTVNRSWLANVNFKRASKKEALFKIKEQVLFGPVDSEEIANRFLEFKKNSNHELYQTPHLAPRYAILGQIEVILNRHDKTTSASADTVWRFADWAQNVAEATWATAVNR